MSGLHELLSGLRFDKIGRHAQFVVMRAENFTWSGGIYVVTASHELDLHNNYDFHSFTQSIPDRSAILNWRRGLGEWVDKRSPSGISIEIFEVNFLSMNPRDPNEPFTEDDCLNCFGYDCDEDWAAEGQFWVDGTPDPSWRWSFLFQSGAEIIVGGERARANLVQSEPE